MSSSGYHDVINSVRESSNHLLVWLVFMHVSQSVSERGGYVLSILTDWCWKCGVVSGEAGLLSLVPRMQTYGDYETTCICLFSLCVNMVVKYVCAIEIYDNNLYQFSSVYVKLLNCTLLWWILCVFLEYFILGFSLCLSFSYLTFNAQRKWLFKVPFNFQLFNNSTSCFFLIIGCFVAATA